MFDVRVKQNRSGKGGIFHVGDSGFDDAPFWSSQDRVQGRVVKQPAVLKYTVVIKSILGH